MKELESIHISVHLLHSLVFFYRLHIPNNLLWAFIASDRRKGLILLNTIIFLLFWLLFSFFLNKTHTHTEIQRASPSAGAALIQIIPSPSCLQITRRSERPTPWVIFCRVSECFSVRVSAAIDHASFPSITNAVIAAEPAIERSHRTRVPMLNSPVPARKISLRSQGRSYPTIECDGPRRSTTIRLNSPRRRYERRPKNTSIVIHERTRAWRYRGTRTIVYATDDPTMETTRSCVVSRKIPADEQASLAGDIWVSDSIVGKTSAR